MSYVLYGFINRIFLIFTGSLNVLDVFSLAAIVSFIYIELCYLKVEYVMILFVFMMKFVKSFTQTLWIYLFLCLFLQFYCSNFLNKEVFNYVFLRSNQLCLQVEKQTR